MFGSYVEAHDNLIVTNNMNPITHECISLIITVNLQVSQKVFCLDTIVLLREEI